MGSLARLPWGNFMVWCSAFGGGGPPQDEHGDSAPITLHFAMALREGADMESAYGDKHRAEQYLQAAQKAVQGVQFLCWNEKNGLIADTPAQQFYSKHSNWLAVLLDV